MTETVTLTVEIDTDANDPQLTAEHLAWVVERRMHGHELINGIRVYAEEE